MYYSLGGGSGFDSILSRQMQLDGLNPAAVLLVLGVWNTARCFLIVSSGAAGSPPPLMLGPPLQPVCAAMPPSLPHLLWRFPVKCDLHVTMERRQGGCPTIPLVHHTPPRLTTHTYARPSWPPWGNREGKATQRSVHLPEGHSDSSILCPAPVRQPPQKGTLDETWQDLSTGQEDLAPWFSIPGGVGGEGGSQNSCFKKTICPYSLSCKQRPLFHTDHT